MPEEMFEMGDFGLSRCEQETRLLFALALGKLICVNNQEVYFGIYLQDMGISFRTLWL
jgi:hypothetical protein